MAEEIKELHCDIETYSSVSLAKCGVYKYASSDDFEILLFGYSINNGEVKSVDIARGEEIPNDVVLALENDEVIKYAHNSSFERICLSRFLGMPVGEYLDPESWRCTMTWAAYIGLPLSLEGVGAVLGLEKQKQSEGKNLIRYFCVPCSPTKLNGGRSRNLPEHDMEKWRQFKEYNIRDVETEMGIQEKLARFPVPDNIWDEYHLSEEINDRGVQLDMTLVRNAIRFDEQSRRELTRLMKELTELDNPNSVSQMKQWLADNGMETDTLGKKAVAELLKGAPEPLGQVLSLRQSLAKSSVRKYQAMENCVCKDSRVRGLFKFYGASRTGRWSGCLLQPQNLPANHLPDLSEARGLVRDGNYEALELLYESVPEVLSELIRTAFVPKDGCKFIVADFSSIERIVLAWLAGEKWVMESYAAKRDLYIATASHMFNVPIENINKKSPLRQKGKVADLACIAEGELVLTNKGLIPIQCVTTDHLVWDGEEWVYHGGVVYNGIREVIEYEGLRATSDHLVWVEGQQKPVRFGNAAASGAHLVQTGDGRKEIRLGRNHQSGKKVEQSNESLLCANKMYGMWKRSVANFKQFNKRKFAWMSKLQPTASDTALARQTAYCGKTTLRESQGFALWQLRQSGGSNGNFLQ